MLKVSQTKTSSSPAARTGVGARGIGTIRTMTTTRPSVPARPPWRSRLAVGAGRTVAGASKLTGLGTGSVIGGRVSLALDPHLLPRLAAGRRTTLVSGTNGKTTTTRLLAAALGTLGPVASNHLGANMPPGIVAALGGDPAAPFAALEVDERWLGPVLEQVGPATVLLLNLSRDQLDRSHEVRKIADTWREALGRLPVELVVANADDPLVAWAAGALPPERVRWVATGIGWTLDAAGCPACAGRIAFDATGTTGWACTACDFARPAPAWSLTDVDDVAPTVPGGADGAVLRPDGDAVTLHLALPGRVNLANAAMVLAAAAPAGADLAAVADAMAAVTTVAGRYRVATIGDTEVRMLLAKNPAGWQEAIAMLDPPPVPVVCAINARIADGRDPSWLWDVPYERLRGRFVVATGERRHDLAVRLRYAEVDHGTADGLAAAVALAAGHGSDPGGRVRVGLIANYTAFQDYLDEVGRDAGAGR